MKYESTHKELRNWLRKYAGELHSRPGLPQESFSRQPLREVLALPFPLPWGSGAPFPVMVRLLAMVAEHSMTMAFSLWCHWMFGYYIVNSNNPVLRNKLLPLILSGARYGSTGLANAMKYRAGLEPLSITARKNSEGWLLDGHVPWASNIVEQRTIIAVPTAMDRTDKAAVFAVPTKRAGVSTQPAPPLLAMDGSSSASLTFDNVRVDASLLITDTLLDFLEIIRPYFLLSQSAFCLGLGRAALENSRAHVTGKPSLYRRWEELIQRQNDYTDSLSTLASEAEGAVRPTDAAYLRLRLGEWALESAMLEFEGMGGAAYVVSTSTCLRLREALFLPVQSPTFEHLRFELALIGQAHDDTEKC